MSKRQIVVLSDIHIGTNQSTVWYQKDSHQPYLIAILDWVISNAANIQELILLGDIVDFWTYPPDQKPPNFEEIIAANPDIFGAQGKLAEVLTALNGRITYVRGNHDMNITQEDLLLIPHPKYKIILAEDIYYPLGKENRKILCTHGHIFTMFNAPDPHTILNPLPIGHFVTRAVSYNLQKTLKPGQTAADLPGQGAPNGISLNSLLQSLPTSLTTNLPIAQMLLDYISRVTGMPQDLPIILPNGQTTTINEAKNIYSQLWEQWVSQYGGGKQGFLGATKAAIADGNGSYLGWFAEKLALEAGANLVVMGHTHTAISGMNTALIEYVNTGFECPSTAEFGQQYPSFVVIDTIAYVANVFHVVKQNHSYQISPSSADKASIIIPPAEDFSCYIIIDNTQGTSELQLINYYSQEGYYVVAPPARISPGEQGRFWMQDYPLLLGGGGTKGQVIYKNSGSNSEFTLSYACPFSLLSSNKCSGANFYTSNDGVNWGSLNKVVNSGWGKNHPFFVRFVF